MKLTQKPLFDARLKHLHAEKQTPAAEIDAACVTVERLRTAMAICHTELGETVDSTLLAAVFTELCAESRNGQGIKLRP